MIIVVDDERVFTDERFRDAIYLRTEDEAILFFAKWFNRQCDVPYGAEDHIDEVWFDHDLGEGNGDGHSVARFFARMEYALGSELFLRVVHGVFVHSQNPVGASRIVDDLVGRIGETVNVTRVELPDCTVI
jgi:hypothetical protein